MNIRYRNFTPEDRDEIIRFWNENSGWETTLDVTEFNLRFCSSPFGEPLMMLAENTKTNEILALCCFLPGSIVINGKAVICYRPFGAIMKESFRDSFGVTSLLTGSHPILKLYQEGSKIAKVKSASLIYLLPDPRWKRLAPIMPFDVCQFSLWSFPLDKNLPPAGSAEIEVKNMEFTDPAIDTLWDKSPKAGLCTVTKTSKYLQWKINMRHGLYRLKGVYQSGHLIGLFTFHFKSDERQWVIGDLLTADHDEKLSSVLNAACAQAYREYLHNHMLSDQPYKVAILATSVVEQKVKALGFYKDNYQFALAVQLLDKKNFSKADVAPHKWLVNAND